MISQNKATQSVFCYTEQDCPQCAGYMVQVVVSFYTSKTKGIVLRIHPFIICSCLGSDKNFISGVLFERIFAIFFVAVYTGTAGTQANIYTFTSFSALLQVSLF